MAQIRETVSEAFTIINHRNEALQLCLIQQEA